METVLVLAGAFAVAAIGVAWVERNYRQQETLPPPDRSVEREGTRQNRQQIYIRRMERQS